MKELKKNILSILKQNKNKKYNHIQISSVLGIHDPKQRKKIIRIIQNLIEQNIIKGPTECSNTLDISNSTDDLKKQLLNQEIINCSDVGWSIVGLSAATWNSFLLLFFLFFNSIYIYKTYYEKKKKN